MGRKRGGGRRGSGTKRSTTRRTTTRRPTYSSKTRSTPTAVKRAKSTLKRTSFQKPAVAAKQRREHRRDAQEVARKAANPPDRGDYDYSGGDLPQTEIGFDNSWMDLNPIYTEPLDSNIGLDLDVDGDGDVDFWDSLIILKNIVLIALFVLFVVWAIKGISGIGSISQPDDSGYSEPAYVEPVYEEVFEESLVSDQFLDGEIFSVDDVLPMIAVEECVSTNGNAVNVVLCPVLDADYDWETDEFVLYDDSWYIGWFFFALDINNQFDFLYIDAEYYDITATDYGDRYIEDVDVESCFPTSLVWDYQWCAFYDDPDDYYLASGFYDDEGWWWPEEFVDFIDYDPYQ